MTRSQKILTALGITAFIVSCVVSYNCGISHVVKTAGSDSTFTTDSFTSVVAFPMPLFIVTTKDKVIDRPVYVEKWDTLWGAPEVIVKTDTPAVMNDYFLTRHYEDTLSLSSFGTIVRSATVNQNRIKSWSLRGLRQDTGITNTIIKTLPRKFVGYWTLSAGGNYQYPLFSIGAGLALKFPGDMVIQAEIKAVKGERPMGEGRILFPIKK